jgi:peptide deformylase
MTLLKIAHIGHPVLRQIARNLSLDELKGERIQAFVDDLVETMHDANGAGLAANQVYEPVAICAIHVENNPRYPYKPKIPLTILVNPELELCSEETFLNYEGCLSVPNLRGEVARSVHIRVRGLDRHGKPLEFEAKGLSAGTFQHELDHLQGKLFLDRVQDTRSLCTWAEFDRVHRDGFVARAQQIVARFGQ